MSRGIDSDTDVHPTDTVPENARVHHFDELEDSAQEYLAHVAEGRSPQKPTALSELQEGDVVVFTDYYHVQ
jgi:hypothetical protein